MPGAAGCYALCFVRDTLCFVRDTLCVVETAKAPGIRLRDAAHAVTGRFALQPPLGRGRGRGRSRSRGGGAGPCRYSLGVFRNLQQVVPPPLDLPLWDCGRQRESLERRGACSRTRPLSTTHATPPPPPPSPPLSAARIPVAGAGAESARVGRALLLGCRHSGAAPPRPASGSRWSRWSGGDA